MTIKSLYPTVRPTLNLDFAKTKALDPRVTFTRASTATFVGSNGLIQAAASGAARFDHNPTTGESLGLLVEEARTNIIVSSSVFNTGGWIQNGVVLSANAGVAPDGTTTATSISQGTGNNRSYHFDNTGAGNKTLTVFAKSNAGSSFTLSGSLTFGTNSVGSAVLNTANGTISTALGCSSVAFSNGWYRFIIPIYIGTGSGNTNYLELNGPASSVFVWGVQIEAGAFPTSYIPTTTATVTRAADVASMTGTNFSSWYNQSQGTIFASVRTVIPASATNGILQFTDGTTTNRIDLYQIGSGAAYPRVNVTFRLSGSTTANFLNQENGWNPDGITIDNWAFAFNSTNYTLRTKYSSTVSTGTAAYPQNLTNFAIGHQGAISRLAYYPVRLPDAQLQALTAT